MSRKSRYTKEEIEHAVKNSKSVANVCRILNIVPAGGNYLCINNLIKKYDIDKSHFTGQGWNAGLAFKPNKKYKIDEILIKDSTYTSSNSLRNRLFDEGYMNKICQSCYNIEWLGEPISLELHHKDGDRTNNELNNLQILCPNCHSMTSTFRGKNKTKSKFNKIKELEYLNHKDDLVVHKPKNPQKEKVILYCKHCQKECGKNNKFCSTECYREYNSTNRPSLYELMDVLEKNNFNFTKVAIIYNVSDNGVRKWLKLYKVFDDIKLRII